MFVLSLFSENHLSLKRIIIRKMFIQNHQMILNSLENRNLKSNK